MSSSITTFAAIDGPLLRRDMVYSIISSGLGDGSFTCLISISTAFSVIVSVSLSVAVLSAKSVAVAVW